MRNIAFIVFALLLLNASCIKSRPPAPVKGTASLIGDWQWVSTTGGFAGIHETPASTGKHLKYTFKSDSSCVIVSDTTTEVKTFSIRTDTVFYPGQKTSFITFTGWASLVLSISHDTLFMSNEYVDGFNYTFVKM